MVMVLAEISRQAELPVSTAALAGLESVGPRAAPALAIMQTLLSGATEPVRAGAAAVLASIATSEAQQILSLDKDRELLRMAKDRLAAMAEGDPAIQSEIVTELAALGVNILPVLRQALKDARPVVRATAARAIGRIGPRALPAAEDLIAALQEEEWAVRREAATALEAIGASDQARWALFKFKTMDLWHRLMQKLRNR
jgi:HEAT repeat protein